MVPQFRINRRITHGRTTGIIITLIFLHVSQKQLLEPTTQYVRLEKRSLSTRPAKTDYNQFEYELSIGTILGWKLTKNAIPLPTKLAISIIDNQNLRKASFTVRSSVLGPR